MSSAVISVPTTASRFALLQIDSDSDSDPDPDAVKAKAAGGGGAAGKARSGKASGAKTSHGTADKKREKKKRRKEQQQSEANELRSLAFKKLPQRSSAAPAGVSVSAVQRDPQPEEGWTEWKQRDEQLTSDLYQADLEKALMLSKLEFEQQKNDPERSGGASPRGKTGGRKERKKNPRVTVSLTAFQQDGEIRGAERQERKQEDTRFFNQLQTDVTQTLQRDRLREHSSGPEEAEQDVRTEQLKYDLEKKEEEIQKLKVTISQWEERYKEVKARNAQLLKMLQQGEMKDKAEILLQVQELLGIKGELSSQVAQLHTALEQERSKVKGLQAEQPKHQGNRKSKKAADGAS